MTMIMLSQLAIPITFSLILKILFFSIVGATILGAIQTIFAISSFWTYRSQEVIWSSYKIYTLSQYPIDIYNGFIKVLITMILPFAFIAYFPTASYLGFEPYLLYLSPMIAVLLWVIAIKAWNWALSKYRSTGS